MFLKPPTEQLALPHINAITHEGKVVVFGTTATGEIWYTVKQDGFEDNYAATQVQGWENWQRLELPGQRLNERSIYVPEKPDLSVIQKETEELTVMDAARPDGIARTPQGEPIFLLRSRYSTFDQSAAAPVQLVSAMGHLYVFRQSKQNTLLCDRFVLDGITNQLGRKLEIRFKRSGQKYQPLQQNGSQNGLSLIDSLDFQDTNGNPFYEPTTELSMVKPLVNGWFSVVLLPTIEQDQYCWHIFAYDRDSKRVELISLRSSAEGLFDISDTTILETDAEDTPRPRHIPGILRRQLELDAQAIAGGLAATKYDVQVERMTDAGEPQLLRESTRVMLTMKTEKGEVAALSFAAATDGTLAQIDESPVVDRLRSRVQEVLLPLDTLDQVQAIAPQASVAQGSITGVEQYERDRIKISTANAKDIQTGSVVNIAGTSNYNGHFVVQSIDANTFEVTAPWMGDDLGEWSVVPPESTQVVFDGMITAFEQTPTGKLRVHCPNHDLQNGDEVQITGAEDYNGTFPIAALDDRSFTVDLKWQPGAAVNLTLASRKRRGVHFDGRQDYVEMPFKPLHNPKEFTLSCWVKLESEGQPRVIATTQKGVNVSGYTLAIAANNTVQWSVGNGQQTQLVQGGRLKSQEWNHLAGSYDGKTLAIVVNGNLVATVETTFVANASQPLRLGANASLQEGFVGQIADLQIWKVARNPKDIKDSMYLQLTGKEVGLVGYWRLGAIAEGKTRTVVDFSIHGIDGVVYGDAFVSAMTLNRTLKDGKQVIQYRNTDLVAVTQRTTYEESFEFRPSPNVDPNNANGKGDRIFTATYWGKTSHNSDTQIEFPTESGKFEPLPDGWWRATYRFTVPDDVKLVRVFELSDVRGSWQTLDIRKHGMQLVSDAISQATYHDRVTLTTLADTTLEAEAKLREITALERQETALLLEKRLLESRLADVANLTQTQQRISKLKTEIIPTAEREAASLQSRYIAERDNRFNYWCRLCARDRVVNNEAARIFTGDKNFVHGLAWGGFNNQQFRFEPTDSGFYTIICSYENRILDYNFNTNAIYGNTHHHKAPNQQWRIDARGDGFFQIRSRRDLNIVMDRDARGVNVLGWAFHGRENQQWQIVSLGTPSNNKIANAERDWKAKLEFIRLQKEELTRLERVTSATTAERTSWQTRLNDINTKDLPDLQQKRLNPANTAYLSLITNQNRTPQTMPQLAKDPHGLVTQGAILGFVRPMSRITASETGDGMVQLNYFDQSGRIRQTQFDATADSTNPTTEEWLPDAQRVCINCSLPQSKVMLDQPVPLSKDWTIEAWICFPLPELSEWNTIVRSSEDFPDHPILIRNRQQLGTYLGHSGGFFDCGYDLNQLSIGWHHITAVGSSNPEGKPITQFYIDGRKVGEIAIRCNTNVKALGNLPGTMTNQSIGKLAEVRIWEVALSPEEVEVNSKTLLSGQEPGLLAYYPLNEGQGELVRDRTGTFPAKLQAASWWGCTAPIGNPSHAVMHFDGNHDFLEAPCPSQLNGNASFTLSCWVRFNGSKDARQNILYFGQPGSVAGQPTGFHWLIRSDRSAMFGFWDGAQNNFNLADHEGRWVFLASVYDATRKTLTSYINGQPAGSPISVDKLPQLPSTGKLILGKRLAEVPTEANFKGVLSDLRIWNRARTPEELRSDMSWRLTGTEPGLVGYWQLGDLIADGTSIKTPGLVRSQDATVQGALLSNDSVLPFGGDAVLCAEYSTIGRDPKTNRTTAMLRRFLACPINTSIMLFPDKRVEALELKWIGNAQFAPTLLGYIEGAPPVPSENLTRSDDYNGATSIQLTQSDDVEFSWSRSQDAGLGLNTEIFAGVDAEAEAGGVVFSTRLAKLRAGFKGNLDFAFNFQNASTIAASTTLNFSDRLELHGGPERAPKFPDLGTRFVPKNVGYALVVSSLADVYITRLQRSQRMIGYQVHPVDGIPPDINTITFMINPAYTMNGSLDGMTGSHATSDRFFRHVPEMRAQYGSLYPASYFRLQEAYDLKQQIENEDKRRESYFAQFNSLLVDETSLNRQVENGSAAKDIGVNRPEDKPEKPLTPAEQEAADKEKAENLRKQGQANTERQSAAVQQRQQDIDRKIADQEQRTHATASFATWQKRMEDIQIRAGKRNIVNTYVWDADGGLRVEAQSFANTAEHAIGGSFSLNAGLGFEGKFAGSTTAVELTAQATISMTQTMNKTERRSRGFELDVDLSGVEKVGITDFNDNPILPGEKVDRYRFMSFYLESSTRNFQDFFQYVVDPEWLQSNDEEAHALRQTMAGKPNKTWRVLHRVTSVERPALMGFGRDLRALGNPESARDRDQILARLEHDNQILEQKLDAILKLLQPSK
jgi:hypothetical protein